MLKIKSLKIKVLLFIILVMLLIIGGNGKPRIIHAGGIYQGLTYTNSLEALNDSYQKGAKYFEVDLIQTSDYQYVAVHDWDRFAQFCKVNKRGFTLAEFLEYRKNAAFSIMTLDELIQWFSIHEDAYWVTDIKNNNLRGLELIKNNYPDIMEQIIPQIYRPEEYYKTKDLGYKDVILTLYRYRVTFNVLIENVLKGKLDLWAITMPKEDAKNGRAFIMGLLGYETYVHTINSPFEEFM